MLTYFDGLAPGSSTKNRVLPEAFEALGIPLPALATQRAIVDQWQKSQANIAAARARADASEARARAEFLAGLGLREPAAISVRKAFALDFARLDLWGVAQVRESLAAPDPAAGKFSVVRLREVIAALENGWSPKCHPRPATSDEWGVLKLGAVSYGTFDDTANKALPKELKPIPVLEFRSGDPLITRANVSQLVGACAYVESTRPHLMLCDKIFRVVPHTDFRLDFRYLAEVLKTPHLRRQIQGSATGASPTMQNITKPSLFALRLPLPPLATQQALMAEVFAARLEANREGAAADKLTAHAAAELESALLGNANVR